MRVALRTDASGRIGTGHLRRCLSLARALNAEGVETLFVCRAHDAVSTGVDLAGQAVAWLPAPGAAFAPAPDAPSHAAWAGVPWPQDAAETAQALAGFAPDWIVVDHYAFDARWHQAVAQACGARIAVIDDLADRAHAAELLVDQNLHPAAEGKYAGRVAPTTRQLLGPHYALLAREYASAPRYRFRRQVRSIGIFLSGADAADVTSTALLACREAAGFTGEVEVVTSARSPHLARLQQLAARWPATRILTDLPDLRAFFARHDLQVGSGGGAAWERCCIGAPTIAVQIAANQEAVLPHLHALGAVHWVREAEVQRLGAEIHRLVEAPRARLALARAARGLVDGLGSARVAAVLALATVPALQFRPAAAADEALLLAWANDPQTRALGFHPAQITPPQHHAWFTARLARTGSCLLLVAHSRAGTPVGTVRLERGEDAAWTISYALDPALRGWGHGRRLLEGGLQRLRQQCGPVTVRGWVRRDNTASLRVFRALGFQESRAEYAGEPCHLFQQSL